MRLRVALPAILLFLGTVFVQSSFAHSSDCTGKGAQVINCVQASKFWTMFDGQKGAALFRTDQGDFEALFLPEAKTFDGFQVIEQKQDKLYRYSLRGTPRPRSRTMEGKKVLFLRSAKLLFLMWSGADLAASIEAAVTNPPKTPDSCPITKPPLMAFNPPSPYPAELPASSFWFGTENLWTMLPMNGTWKGLPHYLPQTRRSQTSSFGGMKADWRTENLPNLEVTGRRLDAPAPPLTMEGYANSGWTNDSDHPFMVVGTFIPTPGCWEITGDYKGNRLTYVVLVTQ